MNLTVQERENTLKDPESGGRDKVKLRSHGGCLTGPLLEVHPGNTLRVNLGFARKMRQCGFQVWELACTASFSGPKSSLASQLPHLKFKPTLFFVQSLGLENQYCVMWHRFKDAVFVQNASQVLVRMRYDRYIGECGGRRPWHGRHETRCHVARKNGGRQPESNLPRNGCRPPPGLKPGHATGRDCLP